MHPASFLVVAPHFTGGVHVCEERHYCCSHLIKEGEEKQREAPKSSQRGFGTENDFVVAEFSIQQRKVHYAHCVGSEKVEESELELHNRFERENHNLSFTI